jgi:hypothetical protein
MEINDTSGQAHPYWYEWFVGLIEVIGLLDPDSGIQSVAFQVDSIKVWDDVVVQLKSGSRCYQVKHTRANDSLTFGDLVEKETKEEENGRCLLGALFNGWQDSGLDDPATKLILYTNRSDGTHWASRKDGKRRPPLLKFWSWLGGRMSGYGA